MGNIYINVTLDSKLIERVRLDKEITTIGRDSENDIYINNLAISRFHARFKMDGDKLYIEDLESSNGTYINGERITHSEVIPGDSILVGKYRLALEDKKEKIEHRVSELGDSTVMVDNDTRNKLLEKMGFSSNAYRSENPDYQSENGEKTARLILSDDLEVQIESERFVIGNSFDSNLYIEGLFVKKKHATIFRQSNDNYTIINSGSFFRPTRINGSRIDQKTLKSGDIIEIGKHKMLFLS